MDLSKKLPSLGKPRQHTRKTSSRPSNPPVETPSLADPVPPQSLSFSTPVRRILSRDDHGKFLSSPTHQLIVAFVFSIADAVQDVSTKTVEAQPLYPTVKAALDLLDRAEALVSEHPPDDNGGSRFGNPAFRRFVSSLGVRAPRWHAELFPSVPCGAHDELSIYFANAFGSASRIDYGSGHELNFLIHALCLNRLSLLPREAFQQIALVLLPKYLRLMRQLQATYYLEPAGSHGVWGLDDYHFVPFLFGSSQLAHHPFIRPLGIHSEAIIDSYANDFLYLDMVKAVNETKTVQGLRWHSPMLDDISGVRDGWAKIYQGMKRMFLGEVLGKLVVMQHFLFGSLVPAAAGMTEANPQGHVHAEEASPGHVHNPESWSDCCGIAVPGAVGAAQEMKKRLGGSGLRPLPFD